MYLNVLISMAIFMTDKNREKAKAEQASRKFFSKSGREVIFDTYIGVVSLRMDLGVS